jgi:hypothetical protein
MANGQEKADLPGEPVVTMAVVDARPQEPHYA